MALWLFRNLTTPAKVLVLAPSFDAAWATATDTANDFDVFESELVEAGDRIDGATFLVAA